MALYFLLNLYINLPLNIYLLLYLNLYLVLYLNLYLNLYRRLKVILEDSKNTKNDLEFCPSQGFESDRIAKDYAALLALWHFQKTLPLERFDIIYFDGI